jgi:gamma-glutamyl phosphate reductase
MEELIKKGKLARQSAHFLSRMSSDEKKSALEKVAKLMVERNRSILSANDKDLQEAKTTI